MTRKNSRIGDWLVQEGLLDPDTVEVIERERQRTRLRFLSQAIRERFIDQKTALDALSRFTGYPTIDLDIVTVPRSVIHSIPYHIATSLQSIPVAIRDRVIIVATVDPGSRHLLNQIGTLTGLEVRPYAALHSQILDALESAFSSTDNTWRGQRADDLPLAIADAPSPVLEDSLEAEPCVVSPLLDDAPTDESSFPKILPEQGKVPLDGPRDQAQHVLIIEDDRDIAQLIATTAESLGLRATPMSTGRDALAILKNEIPSLLVVDAMLPGVHGFEICRKLKSTPRFASVPILMVSAMYKGWRIAEDIKSTYQVDDFLEKPFRVSELRQRIQQLTAQTAVAPTPEQESAEVHFQAAVEAYRAGDYGKARTELERAEELEPFSSRVKYALGQVLHRNRQEFEAMYYYEKAVELEPTMHAAARNLALLYETQGFKRKAMEMWERALFSAPNEETGQSIKQHLVNLL